ncbi:Dapper [Trichinella pseudospiralis]
MKSANSPEATNCCSRSARHLRIAISKPRSAFHLVDPSSKLINLINQLPSMDFGPCRAGIVDGKFWTRRAPHRGSDTELDQYRRAMAESERSGCWFQVGNLSVVVKIPLLLHFTGPRPSAIGQKKLICPYSCETEADERTF